MVSVRRYVQAAAHERQTPASGPGAGRALPSPWRSGAGSSGPLAHGRWRPGTAGSITPEDRWTDPFKRPSVAGLPGSSIKLLESEIPVRSMPPSHVPGAATRGFPTSHQLAHQVRVIAVLLWDP